MNRNRHFHLHHKIVAACIAAAWVAMPLPALAQYHRHEPPPRYDRYHGYDRHYRGHDDTGAVVAGALLGVAAGAAIVGASTPQPPPTVVYTSPPPPPPPGVVYYQDDGY